LEKVAQLVENKQQFGVKSGVIFGVKLA